MKIENNYIGGVGTLGAVIVLEDLNLYGLTCFHSVFGLSEEVDDMSSYYGDFKVYEGFNKGLLVGKMTQKFNKYLDFALIKLDQVFINLINSYTYTEAAVVEGEISNTRVLRFNSITNESYFGIASGKENDILIRPDQVGDISSIGDSGSIWILEDFADFFHFGLGLHRGLDINGYDRIATPLSHIRDEINFVFYSPDSIS